MVNSEGLPMLTGPVKSSGEAMSRIMRFHQIVHVTEGTGLCAVAVNGDGLVPQRLHDEVGHHPAVMGQHSGTIGIEDAAHLHGQAVLPPVREEQRLGAALALVIAGADADGADAAR